jgi:flagellar hook-length control protein FliK
MNPTSIEYLYQNAPPVPDRTPTTSRGDDGSSGFDDHLNQATSSALDIVRTPNRSDSRPSYSPVKRSSSENDDSNRSSSAARPPESKPPQKDASSNDTNVATNAGPATDTPRAASRDDDKHDDHRDKSKSDDGDAASAAGTAQVAANDTAKSADKSAKGSEQRAVEDADDVAKLPAAKVDDAASNEQVKASAADVATDLKAGGETKKTATDDVAIAEQATDAKLGKAEVTSKSAKTAAKSNGTKAPSEKAALTKESTQTANTGEQSVSNAAASSTGNGSGAKEAQTAVDATQLAAKTAADQKANSETEQHHSDKDAISSAAPTDATVAADATTSATAVAAVVAPNPIAAGADKSNNADDSAAKPIDAKPDAAAGALGRAFQKDLGASSKTSGASDSSPVDITRFVSRVAKAVQTASDRDGVVQLRLSPPELGSLKIQLTVKDGVMSAALEADNSNARRMLLDHLPALRDRLAGQNIRVDRFDVDVKQESNGGQANPRGSNQNPYQEQAQRPEPRRATAKLPQLAEAASADVPVAAPRINAAGINLVI